MRKLRVLAVMAAAAVTTAVSGTAYAGVPEGVGETYQNALTGYCMGVSGGYMKAGQPVIEWDCLANHPDQSWVAVASPDVQGAFVLENSQDKGMCLSVAGKSTLFDTHLVIWPCKGSDDNQDQLWWISTNWWDGSVDLRNYNSSLDVSPDSDHGTPGDGTAIVQTYGGYYARWFATPSEF